MICFLLCEVDGDYTMQQKNPRHCSDRVKTHSVDKIGHLGSLDQVSPGLQVNKRECDNSGVG